MPDSDYTMSPPPGGDYTMSPPPGSDYTMSNPPSVDAAHAAGSEIIKRNVARRQAGEPELNTDETNAILYAYKVEAGENPGRLRAQIDADVAEKTRQSRGILGQMRAGAFSAITEPAANIAGMVSPDTGSELKNYYGKVSNLDPNAGTFSAQGLGSTAGGIGMFALEGPTAPFIAAAGGCLHHAARPLRPAQWRVSGDPAG